MVDNHTPARGIMGLMLPEGPPQQPKQHKALTQSQTSLHRHNVFLPTARVLPRPDLGSGVKCVGAPPSLTRECDFRLACFVVFYSEQDRQEDGTAGSPATDWGVPPKANQAKK